MCIFLLGQPVNLINLSYSQVKKKKNSKDKALDFISRKRKLKP